MRFFASVRRNRPDRSIITFFFVVNGYSHERDPRTIRRNLRIADPNKIPQIFFGDAPFFREDPAEAGGKDQKTDKESSHKRYQGNVADPGFCFSGWLIVDAHLYLHR